MDEDRNKFGWVSSGHVRSVSVSPGQVRFGQVRSAEIREIEWSGGDTSWRKLVIN